MRITKVKINKDKKIHIEYQKANRKGSWDDYSLTCIEEALTTFYGSLNSLKSHVCEICEFQKDDVKSIIVKGVTFSYGGESDTMGATIISQKVLKNSNTNLNVNTPHKIEEFYSKNGGDENQLLPEKCVEALYKLIDETILYISGERAQGDLFKEKNQNKKSKQVKSDKKEDVGIVEEKFFQK